MKINFNKILFVITILLFGLIFVQSIWSPLELKPLDGATYKTEFPELTFESYKNNSFQNNLISPPVYTRPVDFRGWKVPDVLLSGNFGEIEKWKEAQAYERTKLLRPDLLEEK